MDSTSRAPSLRVSSPLSTSLCTFPDSAPPSEVCAAAALWKEPLQFPVVPRPRSLCQRGGRMWGRPGIRFLPKVSGSHVMSSGPGSLLMESETGFPLDWHRSESVTPLRELLTAVSGQMIESPPSAHKSQL